MQTVQLQMKKLHSENMIRNLLNFLVPKFCEKSIISYLFIFLYYKLNILNVQFALNHLVLDAVLALPPPYLEAFIALVLLSCGMIFYNINNMVCVQV